MSKIYTKTGDKGTTGLFCGTRLSKSHIIFEILGSLDELNASLAICKEYIREEYPNLYEQLEFIQSRVMDICSTVATPKSYSSEEKYEKVAFDTKGEYTKLLEKYIDNMDEKLTTLRNFILPGGGITSSNFHLSRTIARRAERTLVILYEQGEIDVSSVVFINRLSDYLFTVARYTSKSEVIYKPYSFST